MLKISSLLKILGVILLGTGAVIAMAYYANPTSSIFQYPKSIYEHYFKKPTEDNSQKPIAPLITKREYGNGCRPRIWWLDSASDEDGVRFYRRLAGQPNFDVIETRGPHAGYTGIFDDNSQANLPVGTYEYRVSVFNESGETFSNISDLVAITSNPNAICHGPFSPVLTDRQVVEGTCDVHVWFEDHAEDEDGLRLYRTSGYAWDVIAELGPHAGIPGEFIDHGLPPATYYSYKISAFNEDGEMFSNISEMIMAVDLDQDACKEAYSPQSNPVQSGNPFLVVSPTATLVSTVTPGPVAQAQACIWTAAINVFIRTGPGASLYPEITAVVTGTSLPVIGQSEDGFFWALDVDELIGYVSKGDRFGSVIGDCNVPKLQDPTPPPPTAAPVPQCSDGVDNDLDGTIDMRDRDCTSPQDKSE